MVLVDTPARMTCDAPGCTESQPVRLALMTSGTLGFKPSNAKWQVGASKENGAFITRCPEHFIQKPIIEVPGGH